MKKLCLCCINGVRGRRGWGRFWGGEHGWRLGVAQLKLSYLTEPYPSSDLQSNRRKTQPQRANHSPILPVIPTWPYDVLLRLRTAMSIPVCYAVHIVNASPFSKKVKKGQYPAFTANRWRGSIAIEGPSQCAKCRSSMRYHTGWLPHAHVGICKNFGQVIHTSECSSPKHSLSPDRSKTKLSFLFESASTTETIGRYSFLGAGKWSQQLVFLADLFDCLFFSR